MAYRAASTTVSLIPLLTPRSLENSDKQHLLLQVACLASNAAAVALMADRLPNEAVRPLELGRGVIIGSLHERRADVSALQQKHPQLAEEFIDLRNQLGPTLICTHSWSINPRVTVSSERGREYMVSAAYGQEST
ncbi:hypothetical protein F5883DRAFT_566793 [Diaporthe sp. PMI_573]|nr:hypothetical protein F5883DRAFT_566793 [Diaporthaceae sp. PMI_573]